MNLYLIAHKVRGEAAFDVAERMDCPMCQGSGNNSWDEGCVECDGLGYWWIIPTSGHRAHPYTWTEIDLFKKSLAPGMFEAMPPSWPDHYPCNKSPTQPLLHLLGLLRKEPKVTRR